MKACNADSKDKGLKVEERKKFMSACLKGLIAIRYPGKRAARRVFRKNLLNRL